ncbi:MAG: hemolysin secretion protein D [gamma proteobacterium symbiont of Ctena orbiculata]|nr:MAG: hemolysin secretion protein D [gamma proteobacterium symbiont of Ctena orbiculata]
MDDKTAALLVQTPRGGRTILWMVFFIFILAIIWASWAELDEVTRGVGKVIPSSQIQVIQNLEGGILSALYVQAGDTVEQGQVLMQLDDTRFSSSLRETRLQFWALKAKAARLQAETHNQAFEAPPGLSGKYPALINQEQGLFNSRQKELQTNRSILSKQVEQIRQEINELNVKSARVKRNLSLVNKELNLSKPLLKAGAISEVEILRLEKEVSELEGELETASLTIPRMKSRLEEAEQKVSEILIRFQNEAHVELNEVLAELSQLQETSIALEDRVTRTAVRSPVKGKVKQVMINTLGGVIQPGMELLEIVPLDDSLLVEAKVGPKDIAFLHPGQKAIVKLTAYDFAIYGALTGKVEHISADTIKEEHEQDSYYLVRVRTDKTDLGTQEKALPIISGMQAEVDILTGKKSVLEYLFKPLLRAKGRALRER